MSSGLAEPIQSAMAPQGGRGLYQVLIVDDEPALRDLVRHILRSEDVECDTAEDGEDALTKLSSKPYDLVLLDIDMPKMKGTEVCRRLRESPPSPYLKIIMMSGRASPDELANIMNAGADDYLVKPPTITQLRARVRASLRLKAAQGRSDTLNRNLLSMNRDLEANLLARDSDLVHARNALVLALAEIVNYRDTETGSHLLRLQYYCSLLADEARKLPSFASQIDRYFVEMLACCAPLHDIGKVGLPDNILLKPGKLTPDERIVMQTHTTMGAETLEKVARQHGFARGFLQMGIEITRHHHERFDGTGYSDRLAGEAIPLSARIVAIADVYDALRSPRVYKPAFSHEKTVQIMTQESAGHFDPALLSVFISCAAQFDRIYQDCETTTQ
ncbi:MAG: response regulator [Gemmataceae bacterium]